MQDPTSNISPQEILQGFIRQQIENLNNTSHNQSTQDEEEEELCAPNNVYFDKQLTHLVVSEEFDFEKISALLTAAFKHQNINTSEKACCERWYYIHRGRGREGEIKEKMLQGKRARAIAGFSNPYSLYSVDELIQNLERNQKLKAQKKQQTTENLSSQEKHQQKNANVSNYSIFADSFRKISDFDQYQQLHAKMLIAMGEAEKDVYEEKPMLYVPEYERSSSFQIKGQQLTADRAKKLMAYQIEMQKIGRELTMRSQRAEQKKYESVIKKKMDREQKQQQGDFQDDWDEYESD